MEDSRTSSREKVQLAMWRDTELEEYLGHSLTEPWTEGSLRNLLTHVPRETDRVEYKNSTVFTRGESPKKDGIFERAKSVAALANSRGGLIVYGITDTNADAADRMRPAKCTDIESDAYQSAFRRDLVQRTSPIVDVRIMPITANDGGFYWAVIVEPSPAAPHAVSTADTKDKIALHFPHRAHSHTYYLSEVDLPGLYARRARTDRDRDAHASAVWDKGIDAVRRHGDRGVWLAAAVVPDIPFPAARLSREARDEIDAWDKRVDFPDGCFGLHSQSLDRPFPAPGRVEYLPTTRDLRTSTASPSYRALHSDGSGFAALQLHGDTASNPLSLQEDALTDAFTALIPYLCQWSSYRSSGTGRVLASYVAPDAHDGSLGRVVEFTNSSRRFIKPTMNAETVTAAIDLAECVSTSATLTETYPVLLELCQVFGADPDQLRPDGSFNPVACPTPTAFTTWRQAHNVTST